MGFTKHVRQRQQQRGISNSALAAVLDWGWTYLDTTGAEIAFLTAAAAREAKRLAGVEIRDHVGITAVIDADDVLTSYRRSRPLRRWRRLR